MKDRELELKGGVSLTYFDKQVNTALENIESIDFQNNSINFKRYIASFYAKSLLKRAEEKVRSGFTKKGDYSAEADLVRWSYALTAIEEEEDWSILADEIEYDAKQISSKSYRNQHRKTSLIKLSSSIRYVQLDEIMHPFLKENPQDLLESEELERIKEKYFESGVIDDAREDSIILAEDMLEIAHAENNYLQSVMLYQAIRDAKMGDWNSIKNILKQKSEIFFAASSHNEEYLKSARALRNLSSSI